MNLIEKQILFIDTFIPFFELYINEYLDDNKKEVKKIKLNKEKRSIRKIIKKMSKQKLNIKDSVLIMDMVEYYLSIFKMLISNLDDTSIINIKIDYINFYLNNSDYKNIVSTKNIQEFENLKLKYYDLFVLNMSNNDFFMDEQLKFINKTFNDILNF